MADAAGGTPEGDLKITRLELRTIVAADLGWAIEANAADTFLRDRGRPGWLNPIAAQFTGPRPGFDTPRVEPPSYGRSNEHGRQMFSEEFSASYMPLVSTCSPATPTATSTTGAGATISSRSPTSA